jgi:hypothetical protein
LPGHGSPALALRLTTIGEEIMSAKAVREYRARAKQLGLVRVEVYVPEHRKAEIKKLEIQWRKETEKRN